MVSFSDFVGRITVNDEWSQAVLIFPILIFAQQITHCVNIQHHWSTHEYHCNIYIKVAGKKYGIIRFLWNDTSREN